LPGLSGEVTAGPNFQFAHCILPECAWELQDATGLGQVVSMLARMASFPLNKEWDERYTDTVRIFDELEDAWPFDPSPEGDLISIRQETIGRSIRESSIEIKQNQIQS